MMSDKCSRAFESACFDSIAIICWRASDDSTTPKYAAASSTSIPSGREAPSGTPSDNPSSPIFANLMPFLRLLLFSSIVDYEPNQKSLSTVVQTNPFPAIASARNVPALLQQVR